MQTEKISKNTLIHAPDLIHGGASPYTYTVETLFSYPYSAGETTANVVSNIAERIFGIDGNDLEEDEIARYTDSDGLNPFYDWEHPDILEEMTLADIRSLVDDPNAYIISDEVITYDSYAELIDALPVWLDWIGVDNDLAEYDLDCLGYWLTDQYKGRYTFKVEGPKSYLRDRAEYCRN